jgi:hypothetical protein
MQAKVYHSHHFLVYSLPALINIGALLTLIMFIYAIIGMSSFGNLKITGGVLDEDVVNFKTFASSFVKTYRNHPL